MYSQHYSFIPPYGHGILSGQSLGVRTGRGRGGGERGKGRRCTGESVGCLEGRDDDQPNLSLSKMLKSLWLTCYWLEKSMYRVRGTLVPFFPGAKIPLSKYG